MMIGETIINRSYQVALENLRSAARTAEWVRDRMPGDDLGAEATAVCILAVRDALKALSDLDDEKFDCEASLSDYRKRYPGFQR